MNEDAFEENSDQINWARCKSLFLPFDGMTSQIHIVNIDQSNIKNILAVINKALPNSLIGYLSSKPISPSITLDSLIVSSEKIAQALQGQTTIDTHLFPDAHLTFDFWPSESKTNFDLEIWFWADQMFPDHEDENYRRFVHLMSIIKPIAQLADGRCIATPGEVSDPLVDLENGIAIALQIE